MSSDSFKDMLCELLSRIASRLHMCNICDVSWCNKNNCTFLYLICHACLKHAFSVSSKREVKFLDDVIIFWGRYMCIFNLWLSLGKKSDISYHETSPVYHDGSHPVYIVSWTSLSVCFPVPKPSGGSWLYILLWDLFKVYRQLWKLPL